MCVCFSKFPVNWQQHHRLLWQVLYPVVFAL
jgi:hypothetical protein